MAAFEPWDEIIGQAETQWYVFIADPHNTEAVHQSRIKLRQLRSMLAAAKKNVSADEYAAWQQEWGDMAQLLGDLRQWDVLEETWNMIERQSELVYKNAEALPWRRLRETETERGRTQALTAQAKQPWQRFRAWLEHYRKSVSPRKERRCVRKRLDKWIHEIERITEQDTAYDDTILMHKRRILGKKLRYALGAFFPNTDDGLMSALKRWQACLGALNDSETHRRLATEWADNALLPLEQKGLLIGWEAALAAQSREQAQTLEKEVAELYWRWRRFDR